jgi:hypothetical protein
LIRRSPQFVYYNRIDRLGSWTGRLVGGHPAPPSPEKIAAQLTSSQVQAA